MVNVENVISDLKKHPSDISEAAARYLENSLFEDESEQIQVAIILESFIESLQYSHSILSEDEIISSPYLTESWKDIWGGAVAGFLEYWMRDSFDEMENFSQQAPSVLRNWIIWAYDENYFDFDKYRDFLRSLSLSKSSEVARLLEAKKYLKLIHSPHLFYPNEMQNVLMMNHFKQPFIRIKGYMKLTKVEKDKAFLRSENGEEIGPVMLGKEVTDLLYEGDVLNVSLGRFGDVWKVVESGNVYAEGIVF